MRNDIHHTNQKTSIPINVSVKDNYGNVVASANYTTAGTYNLSFTPASASATYTLEFNMTKASAFCFFRVDDVLVSYDDTTSVTVCKEVEDGYRYGFNGMEKDDQVSGKGNSYTAEFWQYDSRLGRRWNIDPFTYSWQSSYVVNNNPILFYDPLGLWGNKNKAEKQQEKSINKLGESQVGNVFNKNEGTDKKADWGFLVYGEGKDKYSQSEYTSEGTLKVSASRPDASVFNNNDFKSMKSKFGLHTPLTISLSFSFFVGGGASWTIGFAQDKYGKTTGFQTVGGGLGVETGVSLGVGGIEEVNKREFTVDKLEGKGFQYGAGVGPISITKSGDIVKNQFQFNGENYNVKSVGGSPELKALKLLNLAKIKGGASYQWNKTFLFGRTK